MALIGTFNQIFFFDFKVVYLNKLFKRTDSQKTNLSITNRNIHKRVLP